MPFFLLWFISRPNLPLSAVASILKYTKFNYQTIISIDYQTRVCNDKQDVFVKHLCPSSNKVQNHPNPLTCQAIGIICILCIGVAIVKFSCCRLYKMWETDYPMYTAGLLQSWSDAFVRHHKRIKPESTFKQTRVKFFLPRKYDVIYQLRHIYAKGPFCVTRINEEFSYKIS